MKRFVPEIIAIACAALCVAFCATSCANRQAKADNTPLPELPPIPEVPEKLPIGSITMAPPDSFPEEKLDIPVTPGPFQPTWESIEENYPAYQRFEKLMREVVGCDVEDIWEHLAFTNYVQFFVPTTNTYKSYLSNRDFEAFIETLVELRPDIVISWGMVTIDDVRTNNKYVIDKEKLSESEWYICHLNVPDIKHFITLFCCFHPSSKDWNEDFSKCVKYLKQELVSNT